MEWENGGKTKRKRRNKEFKYKWFSYQIQEQNVWDLSLLREESYRLSGKAKKILSRTQRLYNIAP